METLKDTFGNIVISRSDLEELQSNYSQQLVSLRDRLNLTLQNCGHPCRQVSLDGLAFATNFSTVRRGKVWMRGPSSPCPSPHSSLTPGSFLQIPGVEQQLKALSEVSDSKIETELEEVRCVPFTQAQSWVLLQLLGPC